MLFATNSNNMGGNKKNEGKCFSTHPGSHSTERIVAKTQVCFPQDLSLLLGCADRGRGTVTQGMGEAEGVEMTASDLPPCPLQSGGKLAPTLPCQAGPWETEQTSKTWPASCLGTG